MVISLKNKFLFIHNPKVAGSSVRHILNKYGVSNPVKNELLIKLIETNPYFKKIFYRTKKYYPMKYNFYGHSFYSDIKKYLSEETWDSIFKFGFVRNPYDRILSAYNYVYNYKKRKHFEDWANKNIRRFKNFEDFVYALEDKQFQKTILEWDHFKPQYLFFCDEKRKVNVDFIGKLENIKEDFKKISKKLNIKEDLGTLNKSENKNDYESYYNEKMKKIVRDIYNKDFEVFKY